MSISYKATVKRPKGLPVEQEEAYYPVITDREVINLNQVCELIGKRSSMSRADVKGVVHALIDLIPELLLQGRSVRLDELGMFIVHASGQGKPTAAAVTSKDIKALKMVFRPSKEIKMELKKAKFTKVK